MDKLIKKLVVIYVLIGILSLSLIAFTFFPGMIHAVKDSGATSMDKCEPGPRYTEEEWLEHMSHHPNAYKECLT